MSGAAGGDGSGQGGGIAVIGMSGRFPGAASVAELWRRLRAGESGISRLSDEELAAAGVSEAERRDPRYVRAAGVLDGAETFDAGLFGLTPREAEVMDPQLRVFLECAWEALEDAGHDPERFGGWIGVYAGAAIGKYLWMNVARHPEALAAVGMFQAMISNDKDYLPTQVSYRLNLRGPSIGVQTACSTSLVAVHLACQALLCFECDMALAGGVSISLPQHQGYTYQEDGLASPDGCCRTFDARAAGTIRSNGAGIVVLRRLGDALASGDRVLAVIRGSAINNDGASKVGFTAPSVSGQAEVIAAAQAVAGVSAGTIGYVEAHGTATALGDPIEVAALTQAFADAAGRRGTCALGSVKSNLGHLDAAAGVTGLIKTVLSLWHGELPPSLYYETPNPRIDFTAGPFYVNAQLRHWPEAAGPRRAGVSAFGIGGTNAHAVLEEAPAAVREEARRSPGAGPGAGRRRPGPQLLVLSARSEAALRAAAARLAEHLAGDAERAPGSVAPPAGAPHAPATPGPTLAEVAHTLQAGRRGLDWRWSAPVRDLAEARERLREAARDATVTALPRQRPEVALVLPALSAPRPGAGAALHAAQPVFRQAVEECCALLEPSLGAEVRSWICSRPAAAGAETSARVVAQPSAPSADGAAQDPAAIGSPTAAAAGSAIPASLDAGTSATGRAGVAAGEERGSAWRLGQPAHFVCGYALARLWMSWGVEPVALLGRGAGEEVAACLAGVLPLAAALQLSVLRGRLDAAAGDSVRKPILDQLRRVIEDARPQAPEIPLVSSLSGRWAEWEDLAQPAHWVRLAEAPAAPAAEQAAPAAAPAAAVAAPVGAVDGTPALSGGEAVLAARPPGTAAGLGPAAGAALATLLAEPARVLLEVGPRSGLTLAAAAAVGATAAPFPPVPAADPALQPAATPAPGNAEPPRVVAGLSCADGDGQAPDEEADVTAALGWLWRYGVAVNWDAVHGEPRPRRVGLPTYPFERRRYYLDRPEGALGDDSGRPAAASRQPSGGGRLGLRDWFHLASWKRSLPPPAMPAPPASAVALAGRRCLILADDQGLGEAIGHALAVRGWRTVLVAAGDAWRVHGPDRYEIRPGEGDDHARLWEQLAARAELPHLLLHLWNVTGSGRATADGAPGHHALAAALDCSFYSLLHLAHNLGRHSSALVVQTPVEEGSAAPVEVLVFSNRLHAIDGADRPEPVKAALLGPCRVLPQEQDHVRCRCIDVELPTAGFAGFAGSAGSAAAAAGVPSWLVERCLAEIAASAALAVTGETNEARTAEEAGRIEPPPAAAPVVAYRGANRWLPSWEPLPLDPVPAGALQDAATGLRQGGVYLITGGLGGVGLEVAQLLAEKVRARLVLCGRSPFPSREDWDGWLAAHGQDDTTSRRIRRLLDLEALGAELLVIAGDVADRASMAAVRERALARFGAVHGIFHAAGVAGGGLLQTRTPAQAAAVLAPKVAGTLILAEVFGAAGSPPVAGAHSAASSAAGASSASTASCSAGLGSNGSAAARGLDLMVLFSSINALTGGIGQADYCSANAFQDSFALAAAAGSGHGGPRVVSINWDAWREVGMAAQTGIPEELRAWRDEQLAGAIRADEGRDALARILAAGPAQVAIATDGLGLRLDAAASLRLSAALTQTAAVPRGAPHPRPAVAPPYVPPATPDEAVLAGLWQELLGIEPIGRDDSFFEMGGHSLLAAQLTTRIREQLGADLPLRAIFAFPTPALLAQALRDGAAAAPAPAEPSLMALPRESRRLATAPSGGAAPAPPASPSAAESGSAAAGSTASFSGASAAPSLAAPTGAARLAAVPATLLPTGGQEPAGLPGALAGRPAPGLDGSQP